MYRRQGSRPFPRKRNAKMKNGCVRRPYKQLRREEKLKAKEKRKDILILMQSSKEEQRDNKTFLSNQCKDIGGNNRMEKTRDLFKKIKDTKGTFHERWAQ